MLECGYLCVSWGQSHAQSAPGTVTYKPCTVMHSQRHVTVSVTSAPGIVTYKPCTISAWDCHVQGCGGIVWY